ncbi:MAG: heparinase II/III family protein [Bryobacterales bacterium]|nr:heparinase II/III family protein [Bryobacterales bacterium]
MIRARCLFPLLLLCLALSAQTQRFPKPDPEHAFAGEKLYGRDGSPLRQPREDWAGGRQRMHADPSWQSWVSEQRAELDAWMGEPRDKPEYVAGWWHDFVNPVDGGFLTWTSTPPIDAPPKVFGGWVYGLRSRNANYMLDAARMWRLTGELPYFDWAAGQLDFYAANLANWPIQTSKSKSRLMHQSLDDAVMLVRFVNTARLLEGDVPPARREDWNARRQRWIRDLMHPMALMLDETFQRVHNIACWQRSAMAITALYTRDEDLWKRAVDGEFGVRRQVRDGITSDYFWLEQSLGYNSYVVSALLPLFTMAGLERRLHEFQAEAAAVENLMLAPGQIAFRDGRLPTPADSTSISRRSPDRDLLAGARRIFPTVLGIEQARDARNWENLLDPPDDSLATGAASPPSAGTREASLDLESSRFAMLRRDGWQVFFHYGQLDRSHAQAEALNYEAHFEDIDVTHDAGTVGYGSPLHRGYYTTVAAHNVPVIDGQGQQGWNEGELLGFSAESARVSAGQPNYRPDVSARRTLSIEDGVLRDSTTIETHDGAPHRLGIILNVQGKVSIPADSRSAQAPPFAHWDEAREWHSDGPLELTARIGGRDFLIRVEGPGPLRIVHAGVPDAPPHRREALYVETNAAAATFRTQWIPR